MFFYILLFLGVLHIFKESFKFSKVTRFNQVIIPMYSLIFFMINMPWESASVLLLLLIILFAIPIGLFQAKDVEIKVTEKLDEHHRPIVTIKRNTSYIIGWVIVFILGILFHLFAGETLSFSEFLNEFSEELTKDLVAFSIFSFQSPWYIWALSGISSFTYTTKLKRMDTALSHALKK